MQDAVSELRQARPMTPRSRFTAPDNAAPWTRPTAKTSTGAALPWNDTGSTGSIAMRPSSPERTAAAPWSSNGSGAPKIAISPSADHLVDPSRTTPYRHWARAPNRCILSGWRSAPARKDDPMRCNTTVFGLSLAAAFVAGVVVSPWASRAITDAHAEAAPLAPAMIDLMALKHADLPTTGNSEMNAKGLVVTDNATIGIQSGNVAKHMHPMTNEIQYIIEGSGAMWLGGERKEFKPGTLIIIPKGTAHGGTLVTSGPVKAIAIKIPPQPKDDVVLLR
ncbi:MAG: cupin domain-containing protein [Caldimonas sp.]